MVISAQTRSRIDSAIAKYPNKRGALLPAMHLVQAEAGYFSPDCMRELAEIFDIRPVEVMEVVSFYNMFYDEPQPKHHVHVCTNLPCSLRGARGLMKQLESHLAVDTKGNTADGLIHLAHDECMGACAYAPVMRVDEQYHEGLDEEKAKSILDSLRAGTE